MHNPQGLFGTARHGLATSPSALNATRRPRIGLRPPPHVLATLSWTPRFQSAFFGLWQQPPTSAFHPSRNAPTQFPLNLKNHRSPPHLSR
ncbi:hypothetical protein D9619_006176 [Psilocybe cf. subviscida]|uniref:Uncharacterized protein n=1 Tax=Psilocybe cf. subviscida TaxID=2480587 RepID=A0A8H5B3S9_9AGAR|nr:hypothetical protein D9619_006176 [Psilocybe cf. subviscida]